jgi:hypothetical protein
MEAHRIERDRLKATQCFQGKDYADAARLLLGIEAALTPAEHKKLAFCQKRLK